MTACPSCGADNPDRARFCLECGNQLVALPAEVRKMVTVVFTDIVGSTNLGERLDPEAFKGVLTEYFVRMRDVIEQHGGLVEKYIGDAILGIFGIPQLHEDDALRAVRAATEMRAVLRELNLELIDTYALTVQARTGVNTGEVLQGDISKGQTLALGDTVNVAARLEQAAGPDEILIGKTTFRLTRQSVRAEPLEPLDLKGKAHPVSAFRVQSIGDPVRRTGRDGATFVGRTADLAALQASFTRVADHGRCGRVTVIGPAGVGKSRLVDEFVAGLGSHVTVIRGRCLPYGDQIAYWPLRELVRDLIGAGESHSAEIVRDELTKFLIPANKGKLVGDLLGQLLGFESPGTSLEDIAWALRRLLELSARRRPTVIVLDDMQWADQALLDLLAEVQNRTNKVPLLFLYLVRPDSDDEAARWSAADQRGSVVWLEALAQGDAYALVEDLLQDPLPRDVCRRVMETAEGNPLFIEELLSMLIDQGHLARRNGQWRAVGEIDRIELPPTIRALLATRLDQLESDERRVVDPAAVIGKVFQGRAVADLVDEQMRRLVGGLLKVLIGRGLMREDSIGPEGDLYSFRHLLIQDAAYDAMSKRRRSELHESYARWLQEAAGDRANEYEEIVGYHLEQAYHLRMQLGALRDSGRLLGEAAAGWLSRAARRTAALGATAAAARLLRRAAILLPDPGLARMHVMLELGEALLETGDLVEAGEVIAEADRLARANEDANAQAQARVLGLLRQFQFDAEAASVLTRQAAPQLLRTFTDTGDELGMARTWRLLAHIDVLNCRFGQAREGFQRAADHAQAGRNQREEYDNLAWLVIASVWGSAPADAGLQTCRDVLARAGSDLTFQITALLGSAVLKAMLGSTTEARDLSRQAKALIEDLGPSMFTEVAKGQTCAYVEMYSGAAAAAESEALESYRFLDEHGNRVWLSTLAAMLAQATYAQERWADAERYMEVAAAAAAPSDLDTQIRWRGVGARLLARAGRLAEADRLAGEALHFAEMTDFLDVHADSLVVHAEVLLLQARTKEAAAALASALALYERKGNLVSAAQIKRLLTELRTGAATLHGQLPLPAADRLDS